MWLVTSGVTARTSLAIAVVSEEAAALEEGDLWNTVYEEGFVSKSLCMVSANIGGFEARLQQHHTSN